MITGTPHDGFDILRQKVAPLDEHVSRLPHVLQVNRARSVPLLN
jgi:hypothetical protein